MRDGRTGREGSAEVLAVEPVEERQIFRIAHVVPGLHHVGEVTPCRFKNLPQVLHAAAELSFKGVADDGSLVIDRGLAGDKDQIAHLHTGAEGQMRGGG